MRSPNGKPGKRDLLLDAAEQLMIEQGYAAVTSRRVGARAGLSPQLVHYYFNSMDDLFLGVFRRRAEEGLERFAEAMAVDRSLSAVWGFRVDPPGAAFNIEFTALANHRKVIKAEIAKYANRFREAQLDAVTRALHELGVPAEECPPVVVLLAMTGMSQVIALEEALGVTSGHATAVNYIDRLLEQVTRTTSDQTNRGGSRP